MRRSLRQRLYQSVALLVVAGAAVWGYHRVVRPDKNLLSRYAEQQLETIFGPHVEHDTPRIDLLHAVTIENLKVRTPLTDQPTLEAARVVIEHDLLALASGVYRPRTIEIIGARVVARETEEGAALDFPFELHALRAGGDTPAVRVRDGTLLYRAKEGSKRLAPGVVLVLDKIDLDVTSRGGGAVGVAGRFRTRALDQDNVFISVNGSADLERDTLNLTATWSPVHVTSALLAHLAADVADALSSQEGQSGNLTLNVRRQPDEGEGRVRVRVTWRGPVKVDPRALPGAQNVSAEGWAQIQSLLGSPDLTVAVSEEGINIESLAAALAGGRATLKGTISDDGESFRLWMEIRDFRIEDPAVREALDPSTLRIFDAFEPKGRVNADIRVHKAKGRDVTWTIDLFLEDAAFRYLGIANESGPAGFPYPVTQASGTVTIFPGRILFDGVEGLGPGSDPANVKILGWRDTAWTGGSTGQIRLTDPGPEIRLTVLAENVPVDRILDDAVDGSEFRDIRDEFMLEGVLDRIYVDIFSEPEQDNRAVTEVRLELEDEVFTYGRFPLTLNEVEGWVTMRRPYRPDAEETRGQVFAFEVKGRTEGAPIDVKARFVSHDEDGVLEVRGSGVSLAGALTATVLEAPTTKEGLGPVWRWLDPRGRADVEAILPLGDNSKVPVQLKAMLENASIRLDAEKAPVPLEVTELRGTIDVVDDLVRLENLEGRIGESPVTVKGEIRGGPEGAWSLEVKADSLRVTSRLLDQLRHLVGNECFMPACLDLEDGSRLSLDLHLVRAAGAEATFKARVKATDVDGIVRFPSGVDLTVRGGSIAVNGDDIVVDGVEIEGPGLLADVHYAHLGPAGGPAKVVLHLSDFDPPADLLALLPDDVSRVFETWLADRVISSEKFEVLVRGDKSVLLDGDLSLLVPDGAPAGEGARGVLAVKKVELSPPDAAGQHTLSGLAVFRGFSFGSDVPLANLHGEAEIDRLRLGADPFGSGVLRASEVEILDIRARDVVLPIALGGGILRSHDVKGTVADGRLRGRFVLHTREPKAFEGQIQIDDFRLEKLRDDLAPTGPPVSGRGRAQFAFQSRSGRLEDLTAEGFVSVTEGNLGDLPVVANIFAFLGQALSVDQPPRFERAVAVFTLRDEVVHLRRFDLAGPLFDMPGKGTLDLGGFVDLTFTPDFIKSFLVPGIMQFPVVGDVLDAVLREDLLYAIRIRGDISTAEPEVVALPPLRLSEARPFEGTGVPQLPPRRLPRWFR